jgi:hypothetical protein
VDKKRGEEPKPAAKSERKLEEKLEEGLKETFPASDTPAAIQPVHHHPSAAHEKKH